MPPQQSQLKEAEHLERISSSANMGTGLDKPTGQILLKGRHILLEKTRTGSRTRDTHAMLQGVGPCGS